MKELRELVTIVLGREGYEIEAVADGSVALEKLARLGQDAYDLVITDHHMPEMNGIELVHRLRRQVFPGKILVFSSDISFEVRDKYRQMAVDQILAKPIFPAQLRQTLRDMFARDVAASS